MPGGGTHATLRWGVVGTGTIANKLAPMIRAARSAKLAAVASRSRASADAFAARHGCEHAFESWVALLRSDAVDAVYVATPTATREEICIAAAHTGKHVLCEKPFPNLASLERIVAACRDNGVGFMDGTHFVHHPRTAAIRDGTAELLGRPWCVHSTFVVGLKGRDNIRLDPALEPLGAIGDLGWYNVRAAVEYLPPDVELSGVDAWCRRDHDTGAVISGSGVLAFDDGSTATWHCGFDSGAVLMDLRIVGTAGAIGLDDFAIIRADGPATYTWCRGELGPGGTTERVSVNASRPAPALMFEDYAAMVGDPALLERSVAAGERTQRWLDAAWSKALENERGAVRKR